MSWLFCALLGRHVFYSSSVPVDRGFVVFTMLTLGRTLILTLVSKSRLGLRLAPRRKLCVVAVSCSPRHAFCSCRVRAALGFLV